jgi:hypothetical protein
MVSRKALRRRRRVMFFLHDLLLLGIALTGLAVVLFLIKILWEGGL